MCPRACHAHPQLCAGCPDIGIAATVSPATLLQFLRHWAEDTAFRSVFATSGGIRALQKLGAKVFIISHFFPPEYVFPIYFCNFRKSTHNNQSRRVLVPVIFSHNITYVCALFMRFETSMNEPRGRLHAPQTQKSGRTVVPTLPNLPQPPPFVLAKLAFLGKLVSPFVHPELAWEEVGHLCTHRNGFMQNHRLDSCPLLLHSQIFPCVKLAEVVLPKCAGSFSQSTHHFSPRSVLECSTWSNHLIDKPHTRR